MENLATFGAEDFGDFILSYVIGFGMMLCERSYMIPSLDTITDWVKARLEKIGKFCEKNLWKTR